MADATSAAVPTPRPPPLRRSLWLVLAAPLCASPVVTFLCAELLGTRRFEAVPASPVTIFVLPLIGIACARRAEQASTPASGSWASIARISQAMACAWSALAVAAFLVAVAVNGGLTSSCQSAVHAGRPLRRRGRVVKPAWAPSSPSRAEAPPEVASAFAELAREEASAVAAFQRLAAELAQAGAPPGLVARAVNAARDEVAHAALFARLAGDGDSPRPPPAVRTRRAPWRSFALCRLAWESLTDGAFAEGTSALLAARGAKTARHVAARYVWRRIARDEARHARLAWDVLRFCLEEGGASVAFAVRAGAYTLSRRLPDFAAHSDGAAAWGLQTAPVVAGLAADVQATTVERARALTRRARGSGPREAHPPSAITQKARHR